MVLQDPTNQMTTRVLLAGQEIPKNTESRYLGVTVKSKGFLNKADSELGKRFFAACAVVIRQPFFDANLPNSTLRALYRTNIRNILMYGLMLFADTAKIKILDRRLFNCFFKLIIQHNL